MERKKYFIVPLYGWICAAILIAVDLIAFQATRLVNGSWHHYDLSLPIDNRIPLVTWFVIIYIPVAYAQWIYGFYLAARERKTVCYRIYAAEAIAKILCLVCFLVIPTTMVRHDLTDTDFLSRCVQMVYDSDAADNLFPSIHCLESYILTRAAFSKKIGMERCPAWFKWLSVPVTLLVFASTLFMRQHLFVDIIAAIVVTEIGIFVALKLVKERK